MEGDRGPARRQGCSWGAVRMWAGASPEGFLGSPHNPRASRPGERVGLPLTRPASALRRACPQPRGTEESLPVPQATWGPRLVLADDLIKSDAWLFHSQVVVPSCVPPAAFHGAAA